LELFIFGQVVVNIVLFANWLSGVC
jgi:hypothetical protein